MARSGGPDDGCLFAPFIYIGVPLAFWLAVPISRSLWGNGEPGWLVFLLGLGMAVGGGWLYSVAIRSFSSSVANRQERRRQVAPCVHGVFGAAARPVLCKECVRQREREESLRKFAAEQSARAAKEEAARKERERQERHREYVRKIRLPEHLRAMHPGEFERLVCDLFRRQGYEAEPTPISGDGGVDGYLKKDGALAILQCKRVKGSVGEPVLRDLFGTMHSCGAAEGIVVTTGKVSAQARAWARSKPIRIIELDELTVLIRRHYKEDEVVPEDFQPKASLPDLCPDCGKPLRTIQGRRGKFVGCTGYPACRYTRSLGKARHRRHWIDHPSS